MNREFYRLWKRTFVNFPAVRTLLDFTTMFSKYNLNRRNFNFLSAFIVINFSIFKMLTTIFAAVR